MKKSFSLMEVIIAVGLLSVVMLSLFETKSRNIFLLGKSDESKKLKQHLLLTYDSKEYSNRNKNIYLDKFYPIDDDDLRREFKQVKIKLKDELMDKNEIEVGEFNLKIEEYKTLYSIEDKISKNIYRFKLEI